MMNTKTPQRSYLKKLFVPAVLSVAMLSSCTPEGVINKTKYQGQKVTNTCDGFKEEIQALISANSNTAQLQVAQYDNSDFDYYYLDPGQYEIKDGALNWRFSQDLEYEKYCQKRVAIHVNASYKSMDHLAGMPKENPTAGEAGMLKIDQAYAASHKEPFFMYQMPLQSDKDLNGKQISLTFSVVKYNKKGEVKKVLCNSVEVPLGPVTPACCTYQPWDPAAPQSVVEMPEVKINDETYRYRGFTGTLDLIFPMGSAEYDKKVLTSAITDHVAKYQQAGYQVTGINLEGWASLGGKEDKNLDLSKKRAEAVFKGLSESLKDIQITWEGKGEDWARLVLLTKTSALNPEEQNQVLNIAQAKGSNDEKEAELRKLPFWQKLVDEVIVNTRHTFVTFKFDYAPDKMWVEYYPSQMPVVSEQLQKVANEKMVVKKYSASEDSKKNMKVLDILIGNNKKANLYAMRSTYQFASNNYSKAIEDIDQALSLDKSNNQYALAALAYKTKYADTYTLEERMSMLNQYNELTAKYPDNAGLFYNQAVMMDKVGYISGALASYSELLEGKDPSAANLNNRGVAKLKTMRTTEAEADFVAALGKDPKLAAAYFNLALVYAYRGLTNKVVENLEKAVMFDPEMKGRIFSNPAFSVMKDSPKFDKFR